MFLKYSMDWVFTAMHTKNPLEDGHSCVDTPGHNTDHTKRTCTNKMFKVLEADKDPKVQELWSARA